MKYRTYLALLALTVSLTAAHAQLAITEVMSDASKTFTSEGVTNTVPQASDYWELTNFGTNDVSLQDYLMADEGAGLGGSSAAPFEDLTIHAGETILFVRDDGSTGTTNAETVQAWWGPALNPNTVVRFYAPFGFSSGGDGVSLWDPSSNLVDSVHFGASTKGFSFTYDTNGTFGSLSVTGVAGAFQAATTDDVGSPGTTAGPVPLAFIKQPTNLTVVSGSTATLAASAKGLPRAKYQWYFTNSPLLGETGPTLVIAGALTNNAGIYTVVIDNGLQNITSSNATLTVTAAPTPPIIASMSSDMVAYVGQTTTFTVAAQGNPAPSYQWKLNGNDLSGATSSQLTLSSLQTTDSGVYTVVVSNGTLPNTNASVNLLVTPRPALAITEVQSSEKVSTNIVADWWELSNLDTFPVDIYGYRWDDDSANIAVGYVFTNHVIIKPGESIIIVGGNLTPTQFKNWWGESNLPPALQIIGINDANGLGLGAGASGDQVNLWNQAATSSADPIGKVAFVALSQAIAGRTFVRNPDTGIFTGNSTTGISTNGVNGGFTAAQFGDIGSPGWIVDPLILHAAQNGIGLDLSWSSTTNRAYTVFYKDSVSDLTWSTLTNLTANATVTTVTDSTATAARVYRLGVTIH